MTDLTDSERDIIIAALRLWQQTATIDQALYEIAEEHGRFLSDQDIDTLIEEKINGSI